MEWLGQQRDKEGKPFDLSKDFVETMSDGSIILSIVEGKKPLNLVVIFQDKFSQNSVLFIVGLYFDHFNQPLEDATKSQSKKKTFDKYSPFYKMHSRDNIAIAFQALSQIGVSKYPQSFFFLFPI